MRDELERGAGEPPRIGVLIHMDQPPAAQPAAPQNVTVNIAQAKQGCGCISGCGTMLALFWFLGLAGAAADWMQAHEGALLFGLAATILVASPLILWTHRRAMARVAR